VTRYLIFDAENPPAIAPPHAMGVMGYLGGPRAARAWTLDEWAPFSGLRQFGLYVPDITLSPNAQGIQAVQLALGLGWSDKMTGSQQRAIVIDMETSVDAAWYKSIADSIDSRGFTSVAYGSLATVLGNAASDVLAADWKLNPAIPAGQTLHGDQYDANVPFENTVIDYSMIDGWLYQRGGVGLRRSIAA
jgi:hypothetical protein